MQANGEIFRRHDQVLILRRSLLTFGGRDMSVVFVPVYVWFCEWRIMMLRMKNVNKPRPGTGMSSFFFPTDESFT
jgi:hypothetical protein